VDLNWGCHLLWLFAHLALSEDKTDFLLFLCTMLPEAFSDLFLSHGLNGPYLADLDSCQFNDILVTTHRVG